MNEKYEQDIPLNWARRVGRPMKPKLSPEPAPPRIPRITRLMALAIKFQNMVNRGEVRDYADLARLGFVTRARLTQIMNLILLAPDIQEQLLAGALTSVKERHLRSVLREVYWKEQRIRVERAKVLVP